MANEQAPADHERTTLQRGWIEHDGSPDCPVDPNSRPWLQFNDHYVWDPTLTPERRKWRAGSALWQNVIAYRP